jgi:hypothetical protein
MPKKKCPYSDRKGYAYVYVNRKPIPLKAPDGSRCKTGTPEALTAYHRLCIELQSNPTGYAIPNGVEDITVSELCAAYLTYAEETMAIKDFLNCKTAIIDFLLKLYGSGTPVDSFSTKCLRAYPIITSRRRFFRA